LAGSNVADQLGKLENPCWSFGSLGHTGIVPRRQNPDRSSNLKLTHYQVIVGALFFFISRYNARLTRRLLAMIAAAPYRFR
jgi:hypothetical protein